MSDKSDQSKVPLQELNLLDSFLFSASTENPENAKLIARIIIRRVLGINTENIQEETEKQYKGINVDKKGIRLDIQVREYNNEQLVSIYDIEPNSYIEPHLAKRNRYYLSLTDTKYLGTSTDYDKLPEYFSIWILPYDPFGDNRMIYTVRNLVVENTNLVYNEGVTRIFLYTDGQIGGTDEVRTLLKYFASTNEANAIDLELRSIQSIIDDVKCDREVGERYMTLEEYCQHKIDAGIEAEIKARIEANVEDNILNLIQFLRKNKASDEQIISALKEVHSMNEENAKKWIQNN